MNDISNESELRDLYGWPKGRAKSKVLSELEKHSEHFIKHAPFFILSTVNKEGRVDASPRGGDPGFVKILDSKRLVVPDVKGNNRVDSFVNIVETGRIGCLFFIPGINETLRINGKASITTKQEYLQLFSDFRNKPITCLVITIEELFLHCAKAFMRSKLWEDDHKQSRPGFPTIGQMLNDQLGLGQDKETQENMIKRYQKDL